MSDERTAEIIRGRFPGPQVIQPKGQGDGWWHRGEDQRLWVFAYQAIDRAPRWLPCPLEPLEVHGSFHAAAQGAWPLPDRPPNRDRITCALDFRGLYGPEVDEALGVAEPMVDWWEAGTADPTHEEMMRLAALTGFMPWWFYLGTLPAITNVFICRR